MEHFWNSSLVIIVLVWISHCQAHVGLTFPPARKLDLDFLDFVRTKPPCGMPKGNMRTSIKAGSTINVTWHLAYPHRGGFSIQLLDKDEKIMMKLSDPDSKEPYKTGDPTAQWHTVKIPDMPCPDCTIRLLREASEWPKYGYWSCSDVSIVKASEYKEDCFGHGKPDGKGQCNCLKGYYGPRCQFKDECIADIDCGNGKCIDLGGTSLPRRQCFCQAGFHGESCKLQNKATLPNPSNLELSRHNKTTLSDRVQLYYKAISDEMEFILIVNGTSYIALGWRPEEIDKTCKQMPAIEEVSTRNKREARSKPQRSNPTLLEPLYMPERMKAESMNIKRSPKFKGMAPKAEPTPASEPEPEGHSEPSAEPEQAKSEPEPSSEPESSDKTNDKVKSEPEPSTQPESEPAPEGEPEPEGGPSKSTAPKSKRQPAPVPEPEATPESEPETSASEPAPSSEPSSEPESQPEKIPEPETNVNAEPETAADESISAAVFAEPEPSGDKSMFDGPSPYKLERKPSKYAPTDALHPMDCSDIIIGTARGLFSRVRDHYTRDRSTPHLDTFYGGSEDITSATGWEENGVTTIIFRRKIKTTDPTDHPLTGSLQIIWARGQENGEYFHSPKSGLETESPSIPNFYSQDELKYHGQGKQRGVTLLNFP